MWASHWQQQELRHYSADSCCRVSKADGGVVYRHQMLYLPPQGVVYRYQLLCLPPHLVALAPSSKMMPQGLSPHHRRRYRHHVVRARLALAGLAPRSVCWVVLPCGAVCTQRTQVYQVPRQRHLLSGSLALQNGIPHC